MPGRGIALAGSLRLLVAAALLVCRESVAAQPFDLAWDAPAGCPTLDFIGAEFTRVVGRPLAELGLEWREAHASVAPEAAGFRLRLRVVTQAGDARERSIFAASCTEAAEATVAILAAGMAPDAAAAQGTGSDSGAEPGAPAPAAQGAAVGAEASSASAPSDHASLRVEPRLGGRIGLDFGTLAAAAPFAQLSLGVELQRWAVIGLVGATGRVLEEIDGTGAGAQMSLLLAGLEGCYRVTQHNPIVSGCAGVELGSFAARGVGTANSRDGRAFWSASLAEAVLDWNIGDSSVVSLGVTAVVPFGQLHVVLSPAEVHQTAAVAARPWLGLGLRFR